MFSEYVNLSVYDILFFLKAVLVTLAVTGIAISIGSVIGFIMGLLKCSKNIALRLVATVYIEPLRNSPVITQLFLVFYGLPMITSFLPSRFLAAVLTMTLNTGAFFAVIVHASVKAIPQKQWEAGYALGMNRVQTFIYIISRQALRLITPPAITLYIGQLQVSAIVSLIGLIDLTRAGEILTLRTFKPFLIWTIVFALYFCISYPLSRLARRFERKLHYTW